MKKRLFSVEEVSVGLPDLGQECPVECQLIQTPRVVPGKWKLLINQDEYNILIVKLIFVMFHEDSA